MKEQFYVVLYNRKVNEMKQYRIQYKDMFGRINDYTMKCTSKKRAKELFLKCVIFTEIIDISQIQVTKPS
jgi:hypothetical protein